MKPVARVMDATICLKLEPPLKPHVGGLLSNAMPIKMLADGRNVVRLGDYGHCVNGPKDVVFEGAATVLVCGLPIARFTDGTAHGAHIVEGSLMFLVGGPTFTLPKNMTIKGPPDFQNAVVRDVFKISETKTGRSVLEQFNRDGGKTVSIQPESDPHNSFCQHLGNGNSRVSYNPNAAVSVFGAADAARTIPFSPTILLGHELIHAYNNATGTNLEGTEGTLGPASQPDIDSEESLTIGTGRHDNRFPSENSLRDDLAKPKRANHYGKVTDDADVTLTSPTDDIRPGAC